MVAVIVEVNENSGYQRVELDESEIATLLDHAFATGQHNSIGWWL